MSDTCINGHPRTPENTRDRPNNRGYVYPFCRVCNRDAKRRTRASEDARPPVALYFDWTTQAACAFDVNPEWFFPTTAAETPPRARQLAREYCNGCPVRAACLETALATRSEGIWAGTTPADRDRMLRRSKSVG